MIGKVSEMRIGFLLPANYALSGGGQGVRAQAEYQAGALEKLGHEVIRLNPWEPFRGEPLDMLQFFQGGYAHFWIHRSLARSARRTVFAPIIDTNEPLWRYRLAAAAGRLVPKVHTIPAVFRDQGLASDAVIVRSQHERDRVVHGLGIASHRVHLVLNGVNPPPAADPAIARQAFDLPESYLLHVSAYTQGRKNVERLIEAIGPLDIPLIIAGTAEPGATLDRLRSLCDRYRHVRLLGFLPVEMLQSLYAGCRVFALPSDHEGTGLVALEAAAHGAGVVITRNGGPPDYFIDLASYCDPRDTASIRCAVEERWQQPAGDRLRKHVLEHLTWEKSAWRLERVYESLSPRG